jgi:hypothetical protein
VPCSPAMRRCSTGCLHKQMVLEYRLARIADEQRREAITLEYQTEMENYDGPCVTFKQWLTQTNRR